MACAAVFAPAGAAVSGRSTASRRGAAQLAVVVRSAAKPANEVTGVVFEPFAAVQSELAVVERAPTTESYARLDFHPECEAAINEQINIEYNVSYVYHSLYAYFSRDNVALPGIAAFFKKESEEERSHAELLMDYQNLRGGRVKLQSIMMPEMEFAHAEKGEALYAFELALSLEKLNFSKLRALHEVADSHGDSQMCDFIEGDLLAGQADSVKEYAEFVSQLRRVGTGLGVFDSAPHGQRRMTLLLGSGERCRGLHQSPQHRRHYYYCIQAKQPPLLGHCDEVEGNAFNPWTNQCAKRSAIIGCLR
ncbi:chloroplast precursor [Micractinium conductrix]|uniref:Ferritin n=1 Tax=Micractinium conductrix TaxID=554055 RepID=A0A2P6V7F1_9CHLO|nr:chloroplast precursor [Micractinium conductrix]|eukprot:PSC70014.1 chloroplast precursor [Micractinium conductrix]